MATEFNGFHELSESFEELAEEFREEHPVGNLETSGQFGSTNEAIQAGIEDAMDLIVRKAKNNASFHGLDEEHYNTIDHESLGWMNNNRYRHRYFATSDILTFHEFGTGTKAEHPRYDGTVNAAEKIGEDAFGNDRIRTGYLIRAPDDHPMVADIAGKEFTFQYAVHPGVKAKHFMQQALEQNVDEFPEKIGDAIDRRFSSLKGRDF